MTDARELWQAWMLFECSIAPWHMDDFKGYELDALVAEARQRTKAGE